MEYLLEYKRLLLLREVNGNGCLVFLLALMKLKGYVCSERHIEYLSQIKRYD